MAIYNDFVDCYENGMAMIEIAKMCIRDRNDSGCCRQRTGNGYTLLLTA